MAGEYLTMEKVRGNQGKGYLSAPFRFLLWVSHQVPQVLIISSLLSETTILSSALGAHTLAQ